MMIEKSENWSSGIFRFTSAMMPVQSRLSFQPKKGWSQPSGTASVFPASSCMAIPPMMNAAIVITAYCTRSAQTMPDMPPRIVYEIATSVKAIP